VRLSRYTSGLQSLRYEWPRTPEVDLDVKRIKAQVLRRIEKLEERERKR